VRPPGNRNPEPDEIAKCEPVLKAQLAALRRGYRRAGKFAASACLRERHPDLRCAAPSAVRGNQLCHVPPAYLLRDPSKKKEAWED